MKGDCVGLCEGVPGVPTCLCGGTGAAKDAALFLQRKLADAVAVLEFYATPETYLAVAFVADPPSGSFMDDFSDTGYLGVKPGKRARVFFESESE